jgi:hypothetical protein
MNKLRRWINRDDGKYCQIGNENLNYLEVVGIVFMISGLLALPIKKHNLFDIPNWVVYSMFACAFILSWVGISKKSKNDKN